MASVILYHHLLLGDQLICNGLTREYCKKYDKVAMFCLPRYYEAIAFMYRDVPNLTIMQGDDVDAITFIFLNKFTHKYDEAKIIGTPYLDPYHNVKDLCTCEEEFYRLAGVEPAKKWTSFHLERDAAREEDLFRRVTPKGDYAFIHDDGRFRIDRAKVGDIEVVTPVMGLTSNVFDYCLLIEKAKEVHVIDSSFMYIVDLLPDFGQKLFIHRYARHNSTWTLPSLKKNWTIVQ
jgi:hypothetical protein